MLCSCAPMFKFFSAPQDVATIRNFKPRIFSACIIVIFLTTCIGREVCSLMVKSNRSCRFLVISTATAFHPLSVYNPAAVLMTPVTSIVTLLVIKRQSVSQVVR